MEVWSPDTKGLGGKTLSTLKIGLSIDGPNPQAHLAPQSPPGTEQGALHISLTEPELEGALRLPKLLSHQDRRLLYMAFSWSCSSPPPKVRLEWTVLRRAEPQTAWEENIPDDDLCSLV